MSNNGRTCEYVLDPDNPETRGGVEDGECYVDDELLNEDGVWTCPHDAEEGGDLCIFHLPVDEKDDERVVDIFRDTVDAKYMVDELIDAAENKNNEDNTINKSKTEKREFEFLGGKFGTFDLNMIDIEADGGGLNFSYATFKKPLDWSLSLNLSHIYFNGATFHAPIDFSFVNFGGTTDFRDVLFNGSANFNNATFQSDAYFGVRSSDIGTESGPISIIRPGDINTTKLRRKLKFGAAKFNENANFRNAKFRGEANFTGNVIKKGVYFGGETTFRGVEVSGKTSFLWAKFDGGVDFSFAEFGEKASFSSAVFKETVTFSNAEFEQLAGFHRIEFDAEAKFWNVEFRGNSIFTEAVFDKGDFRHTDLNSSQFDSTDITGATFTDAILCDVDFETSLLSRVALFGVDLRGAKLSGAVLGDVRIDEGTKFLGNPSEDGDTSPHTLSAIRSQPKCVYDPDYEEDNEHADVDKAKSVYRALEELGGKHARPRLQAQSFIRRQDLQKQDYWNDATADDASLEERLIAGARWSRARAARAVLLYGESPWRIIGWSLGIIFSFALLYPLGGWMKPEGGDPITYSQIPAEFLSKPIGWLGGFGNILADSFYYSTLTYTALGFGDFQPRGFGRLLTTVETGLGAVLIALLVFVLGRRAAR